MIPESNLHPEESPREILEANPVDWNTRLQSACLLYDQGEVHEASALIWEADRIPCTALDLALAACILAKDQPGMAIRLLAAVLENNRGKAAQNMGMANALLHHGMVLQSARFYGAALEIDPNLVNLEFEHFFIWADDEQLLWGDFKGRRPQLHELPWMKRDPLEALALTRDVNGHTTPVAVPKLNQVKVEASTAEALREKLAENPGDWDTRRTLAQLLHAEGAYGEAAVLIWDSDPIQSIDLAFAAGVLARQQPREAIRRLIVTFEQNRGKAVQNMGMANALLHHGLVIEAARFYGAAIDADPNLVNPDLEHFLLWIDDAKSLWGNFLKIRTPLGLFPWVHSDPTLDFGADFSAPPIVLSELKQVQGENLTNPLYQQLAEKNARITPPPAVTFPADRVAQNDRQEEMAGSEAEEEAKVEAAGKARAAAAEQLAEAAESARTLIERARHEATTEVAAIRAKAQEELQAALELARQDTEKEMAAIRAKAREEAAAAADTARKDAEFQAAQIRAKAEEAAAQAEAAAKQRTEEEERSAAAAKQLAEEQAMAAAEKAAAARIAAEKAREEANSEVAALRAKAQEEIEASINQARQNSEQELAVIRAKAKEEAEYEAALIRTKAEEAARVAEKARLEATAQAETAAKLRAEENDRALALAKQQAEEQERAAAAAKRLAEEQARATAEKIHQEAIAEVSALRAQAQDELKAATERARRNAEQESAAIRAKAEENAKNAAAAAEQARLEAAAQAKASAEILARAEKEAQAQAAAQQARQEALAELAAIKAQAQEELKTATELARLNSEKELQMRRVKAREESQALMQNAAKEAASEVAPISPKSEEDAKLPPVAVANATAVINARAEQERAIPVAGPIAKEQPHPGGETRIRQRGGNAILRFCVLLVSAAAAVGVWHGVPGTPLDRAAFSAVASGSVNGPLYVSGQGAHVSPWKLQSFTAETKPDERQAPVIVSLGDDLDGFFQNSPPAPIDLAVVLTNFQRLGAKKAATAAVLAWETPDPIGLAALEKSLGRFDSLVMTAPLSRGAVASTMPPAFRRSSIPLASVQGDTSALPMVNRIPLPGVVLGGETTLAGFSGLESEAPAKFVPLLARWEDRVVFSFPLLTVLQRLNFPVTGVEVKLGEYLKLNPNGPIVPIDDYGRLAVPLKPISAYAEISAEALIDGGDELFPKQAPEPVILRDDQSAAEPATRAFSRDLSATIALIASNGGLTDAVEYPRLPENWELGILALAVLAMTALCGASRFVRCLGAVVLAGVFVAGQWIAFGVTTVWLPGLSVLAVIGAAMLVALLGGIIFKKNEPVTEPVMQPAALPEPVSEPKVERVPEPVSAAEIPADPKPKPPARKSAAKKKKTTTRKKAAKKTAAKKAAKPQTPPENP